MKRLDNINLDEMSMEVNGRQKHFTPKKEGKKPIYSFLFVTPMRVQEGLKDIPVIQSECQCHFRQHVNIFNSLPKEVGYSITRRAKYESPEGIFLGEYQAEIYEM